MMLKHTHNRQKMADYTTSQRNSFAGAIFAYVTGCTGTFHANTVAFTHDHIPLPLAGGCLDHTLDAAREFFCAIALNCAASLSQNSRHKRTAHVQ